MSEEPFTPEEIAKIRALLPYAETVRSEAEYDAAKRLVLRRWKGMVIALAALVGALMLLWSHFKAAVQTLIGS